MSHQDTIESYIQPQYSMLQPVGKKASAHFSEELMFFLKQHPEFYSSKQLLELLRYCFVHYVNCDPTLRDLSTQEQLKQAMEMAKNFSVTVNGKKKSTEPKAD